MLNSMIQVIRDEVKARVLYQSVKEVSSYHRIQGSNGYRDAAKHCVSYLQKAGIEVHHLQYPANAQDYAGTYKLFKEYACEEAYCDMVYPVSKQLANFQLEPLSIIQKSCACDYRKQPLDVFHMDKGSNPDHYPNIDVVGKVLFIHEHFSEYQWAMKLGALGFISDFLAETPNVRKRADLYDSLNYSSFWWNHNEEEIPAFGFVLTPRAGDELKQCIDKVQKEAASDASKHPFVQVCPYVNATLFDGFIDVVEAVLLGVSEESILITAHLCHPCASANDNASGVAGAMEVMRSLHQLIKDKKIAPLEKTIKMILVPEFTGTYHYVCDGRDLSQYLAGINLDMIGGRQQDMYGPITITNLPHATPSYVDSFANLLTKLIKADTTSFEKMKVSLVNTQDVSFQLGSDHFILSDPMINIPCIMLGQWPDKNYHTSSDSLDIIDPTVLQFSTTLATTYVYALANYDITNTKHILQQIRLQFVKEMNALSLNNHMDLENAYAKVYQFFRLSIQSLLPVDPVHQVEIEQELDNLAQLYSMYAPTKYQSPKMADIYHKVPRRLFSTPIADLKNVLILDKQKSERYAVYCQAHPTMQEGHGYLQLLCDYYTDGLRSIQEISEWVSSEANAGSIEEIYAYIQFMCDVKLMEIVS